MKALHHLYDFLGVPAPVRRDREPPANADKDAAQCQIAARVEAALARDPALAACLVQVDVSGDVVELSGYANSEGEARRTVETVSAIPGVGAVRNRIVLSWW